MIPILLFVGIIGGGIVFILARASAALVSLVMDRDIPNEKQLICLVMGTYFAAWVFVSALFLNDYRA